MPSAPPLAELNLTVSGKVTASALAGVNAVASSFCASGVKLMSWTPDDGSRSCGLLHSAVSPPAVASVTATLLGTPSRVTLQIATAICCGTKSTAELPLAS